ncbi:hypothetical protein F220043C3_38690 [Enterocloster asparagiformis]
MGKQDRFETGRDVIGPPETAGCFTRGHFRLSTSNQIFKEAFYETIERRSNKSDPQRRQFF